MIGKTILHYNIIEKLGEGGSPREDKDIKIPYSVILTDKDMEDLLPRRSGFFFGGKDYDEYYVMDTEYTIDILTSILAGEDGLFYYHSSW